MIRALAIFLILLPGPLLAQPLDGPGFDAASRGRTFMFSVDGQEYGAEQYFPGQRVQWSFLDGRCLAGSWVERGGKICFTYEDRPGESECWSFALDGEGLLAEVAADAGRRYAAREIDGPLYCMGPDTGV